MSNKKSALHTYCNPLSLPDIPRGKDDWYRVEKGMFSHENKPDYVTGPDYRSISDPTVFYYDNKWYLYPSYGMAWVTEDFENWEHIRTEPYCPKYSPGIIPWKGRFLMTSWNNPLYIADNPLGPFTLLGDFIMPDGTAFVPSDPCLFADDDGRIYMYAFAGSAIPGKKYHCCQIIGYELDAEDPRKVVQGPVVLFKMDPRNHSWERHGFYNQNKSFGWIEGPHMLKHNGRYYMIYAAPETSDASYCMAVYYSDKDPLTGFCCQKRNPLTIHRNGIVGGAGHGCVEHGPDNTLWAFYTIAAPYLHRYERRIGMDMVAVDENGELYCPFGVTDTPQYVPGKIKNPLETGNSPGYLSLTAKGFPTATSCMPGRDSIYATDESSITWWEPAEDDVNPSLTCDLCAEYRVGAIRVYWRESGLDYQKGHIPGPIRYLVEGCLDGEWFPLADRRDSVEERNIDYRYFEPKLCEQVCITITEWPEGIHPGIIDFTAFGIQD